MTNRILWNRRDHNCGADEHNARVVTILDALEAAQAENERHRKANLVRAVVRYAEGRDLDAWITEHINAEDFDPVPWRVAETAIAERKAAQAEVERLRAESVPRSALVQVGTNYGEPLYVIRTDSEGAK